jgi:hypothetical protein
MPLYSVLGCFDNRVEGDTDWMSRSSVVLCLDDRMQGRSEREGEGK